MDPLSHAALGRTLLGLAGNERSTGALVAAAALGALSPDLDAVLMPFGWDLYLRVHEIGTHTLAGGIAAGMLTATVIRQFARSADWIALACAAVAGSLSHVGLDLVSSARLRIFWPVDDRQVSIPLVAMADPWLAGLLLTGVVTLLWTRRARRSAAVTLVAAAIFLSVKGIFATRALDAYRAKQSLAVPVGARIVEAKWASLREWYVQDRTGDRVRVWRTNAGSREATLILSWPVAEETSLVSASRSLGTVRNFLAVHQLGFAVTIPLPENRAWVLWSDIRYCWDPSGEAAPQLAPRITEGSRELACALWFGGEFDRNGQAVREVVKVFGFTQTRAPGD
jgi:membrane-bound metal-dependent hydrolase YbcI (DUF457 family)